MDIIDCQTLQPADCTCVPVTRLKIQLPKDMIMNMDKYGLQNTPNESYGWVSVTGRTTDDCKEIMRVLVWPKANNQDNRSLV